MAVKMLFAGKMKMPSIEFVSGYTGNTANK